jgi:hypothetical protein
MEGWLSRCSDTSFSTPKHTIATDAYCHSPGAVSTRVKSPSHGKTENAMGS